MNKTKALTLRHMSERFREGQVMILLSDNLRSSWLKPDELIVYLQQAKNSPSNSAGQNYVIFSSNVIKVKIIIFISPTFTLKLFQTSPNIPMVWSKKFKN